MEKFKTSIFFSGIFKNTGQICSGFGYQSEEVILYLTSLLDMYNCYKTLIADLCDWSNTFIGKDAKWIDDCSPAGNTSTLTIKKWTLQEKLYDTNLNDDKLISLIGGTSYDNRGCWQFAQWTKWTPYVAQASFDAFTHMLADSNSHIGMDYDTFSDEIASGAREL